MRGRKWIGRYVVVPGGYLSLAATPSATVATPAAIAVSPVVTPSPSPRAAVVTRRLFRADDPPATHGLAINSGPLMPLVVPAPCQVPGEARRARINPCVSLLPPGARLCASGAVGEGRLETEAPGSAFALQADHVTLQDLDGATLFDEIQGFVRYDDPTRGLQLMCPRIEYLERVSSNALRIIALCSNRGAEGWAISGQVTDGGINAPDSMSLTVDAPDGSQLSLVGSVVSGVILVRTAE